MTLTFDDVHFVPTYDVISHLVYVTDEQDVASVTVDGKLLMRDGEFLTIDTKRVAREAAELAGRDEALTAAVEGIFQAWREGLESMLERGQEEGWIHKSIQPGTEAGILISMVAGFSVMQRCHGERGLASSLSAYLETLRPA